MTTATQAEPGLLTVPEAAAYLRISRAKAYQMTQAGELPTVRFGKSVRIPRERLLRWIEDRSR